MPLRVDYNFYQLRNKRIDTVERYPEVSNIGVLFVKCFDEIEFFGVIQKCKTLNLSVIIIRVTLISRSVNRKDGALLTSCICLLFFVDKLN